MSAAVLAAAYGDKYAVQQSQQTTRPASATPSETPTEREKKKKHSAAKLAAACMILGIDPAMDLNLLYLAEKYINADLPEGWVSYEDDLGRIYYHNIEKDTTQWAHPLEDYYRGIVFMNKDGRRLVELNARTNPPLPEEVREMATYLGIDIRTEPELIDIAKAAVIAPLPPGWEEFEDSDGTVRYYNSTTEVHQNTHPLDGYFAELVVHARQALPAVQALQRFKSSNVFSGDSTVPHPWKEFTERKTRRPYFYNYTSEEVVFSHPALLEQQDRKQEAARTIQRYARGYLARLKVQRHKETLGLLPAPKKEKGSIAVIKQARAVMAAVTIQKFWRGHRGRRTAQMYREERAVVNIQAAWRGYKARTQYVRLRNEVESVEQLPPPVEAPTLQPEMVLDSIMSVIKAFCDIGSSIAPATAPYRRQAKVMEGLPVTRTTDRAPLFDRGTNGQAEAAAPEAAGKDALPSAVGPMWSEATVSQSMPKKVGAKKITLPTGLPVAQRPGSAAGKNVIGDAAPPPPPPSARNENTDAAGGPPPPPPGAAHPPKMSAKKVGVKKVALPANLIPMGGGRRGSTKDMLPGEGA